MAIKIESKAKYVGLSDFISKFIEKRIIEGKQIKKQCISDLTKSVNFFR